MSLRLVLAVVAGAIGIASSARAQSLDPEPKTPYLWRIVLKVQPHPLLSATFREQLKRDLEAALQPALGAMGTVEVRDLASIPRDQWDPLWQQFDDKGFAALEAPRDLNAVKTHFLKVEYRDGLYLLESRQHDGFTGLSSGYAGFGAPVIRRQTVRAPEMVGRTAGILLDRDFGLDGTVEPNPGNPKEVKVIVRGGQLGPVDGFVKKGDVFAVSEVVETKRPAPPVVRTATGKVIAPPPGSIPPKGLTSRLRTYSLLKVAEVGKDGTLRCEPLGRGFQGNQRVDGYRCMKLGTIDAPLIVRLVGSSKQSSGGLISVRVTATEKGFDQPEEDRDRLDLREGLFRSAQPLSQVACVTVSASQANRKRFPVPILSTDPVNLPFEVNPQDEERVEFELALKTVINRVVDARNAQNVCFEATGKLIEKQKNAEALARAKSGYQAAKAAAQSIKDDVEHLRESVAKSPSGGELLAVIQRNLTTLESFNKQLESLIDTIEKVVKKEEDPASVARETEAQAQQERIKLLLTRGEVDEAIVAYDRLAMLLPGDPNVKADQEKLRKEWAPKNDEHAKARTYLLKSWPAVSTIPEFDASLKELARCVEVCKKNADKYTLRKLLSIFSSSAVKLNELVGGLDPNSENDKKLIASADNAGKVLAAKENEITEWLKQ